jgi:hypothetical protein
VGDAAAFDRPELEIRLRGHLDERWRESFPGLELTHCVDSDGTPLTVLRGPANDEAGLHGVLARIRDLGIPLLLVRRTRPAGERQGRCDRD